MRKTVRCHICDEYRHIIMDCPYKYLLWEHWQHITRHTEAATKDQAQGPIWKIGKEQTTLDHILDTTDITALAIVTCTEVIPDHSTRTDIATIAVDQDNLTPHTGHIATDPTVTHHPGHTAHITVTETANLETAAEHTAAHQATTLETTVDQAHDHSTTHQSTGHMKREWAAQYHIPTMATTSVI